MTDQNANTAPPPVLTYGQSLVRMKFNPSGMENVDKIKAMSAALIDELYNQKEATADGETKAEYMLAIRDVQRASSMGVGAATKHL